MSVYICCNPIQTHVFLSDDKKWTECKICNYTSIMSLFLLAEDICTFKNCNCFPKKIIQDFLTKGTNIRILRDSPREFFTQPRRSKDKRSRLFYR